MADRSGQKRLLFVSNGLGEDSIAAEIIRRLPQGVVADAYPTLGAGAAFEGICDIVGPRAHLASEGARAIKGSVSRDIATGGLATVWPGVRFLSAARRTYDHVIVVGDLVGVGGCFISGHRGITWLDVYRTGYGRHYSAPERWLIGATCRTVFSRSEKLAQGLRDGGVNARCAGNVMLDTVTYGDYDAAKRRGRKQAVTLLPGSRQFTAANFALQVEAIKRVPETARPDVFLALANGVDPQELAAVARLTYQKQESREASDAGIFSASGLAICAARGATGNLIAASDFVLSQAGTATIQAIGLGRPAISFSMTNERRRRIADESALFGDARILTEARPAALAEAITLLSDAAECARRGETGMARVGGPGAITAIIAALPL